VAHASHMATAAAMRTDPDGAPAARARVVQALGPSQVGSPVAMDAEGAVTFLA
jgi:hypothetical protein